MHRLAAASGFLFLLSCSPATKPPEDPGAPEPNDVLALSAEDEAARQKQLEEFGPLLRTVGSSKFYIERMSTLLLFEDEAIEAQTIIADWAAELGLGVLSPGEVESTIKLAARGLHPTTKKTCGPPLERVYATRRWLPQMGSVGHLRADVYCKPNCTIQLAIQLDRRGTEFFAAGFDPAKPWRQELHRSLRALADNGGHNKHGHLNNPVELAGVVRGTKGTDMLLDTGDVIAAEPTLAAKATACGADLAGAQLLVENSGGSLRCEGFSGSRYDDSDTALTDCLCKHVAVTPTQKPRSVISVQAPREPAARPQVTTSGKALRAYVVGEARYSELAWSETWFLPACDSTTSCYELNECFVARTENLESTSLTMTLEFDATGTAASMAFADLSGILSADERTCIKKRYLGAARIPCPDKERSFRTARLDLSVTDK